MAKNTNTKAIKVREVEKSMQQVKKTFIYVGLFVFFKKESYIYCSQNQQEKKRWKNIKIELAR